MVLSQLHPAVQYKEQKELYDDDIDMETKLYNIFFPTMRLRINIAVGRVFLEENVLLTIESMSFN